MKRCSLAALSVLLVLASPRGASSVELKRPSLAGLSRFEAVIVTVSDDTVDEEALRRTVEDRLAKAKIAVDGAPGPHLYVTVSAEHSKSDVGTCEFGNFKSVIAVLESVRLDRAPDLGSFSVTTWRKEGQVRRFSLKPPRLGIMDNVNDGLTLMIQTIAADTKRTEQERQ